MAARRWKLGVVSYLNARPLIEELVGRDDVELHHAVPARLLGLLLSARVDAAMVPVIDYLRHRRDLEIISDACIGADGPTMTVRVYSTVRPELVEVLRADGESRTSVVLAQVLWWGCHRRRPVVRPYEPGRVLGEGEAVLLIGDKVVSGPGGDFAYDLDLGGWWKEWTDLPFVFAAWVARRGTGLGELPGVLSRARDGGVARCGQIARRRAAEHGWSEAQAAEYLTRYIKFTMAPKYLEGLNLFFDLATEMGLAAQAPAAGRELAR